MILKNVELFWAKIAKPDEEGYYRIAFKVTPEQATQIDKELEAVVKEKGKTTEKAGWMGSKKIAEDGAISYGAKTKAFFKDRQGNEVPRPLTVVDIAAQKFAPDAVPMIANGAKANINVDFFYCEYKNRYGGSIGLKGVQLLKYEIYEGDGASAFEDLSEDAEIPF